ncbi:hypothetical protein BST22_03445 [Mycolicibacterium chubuense]|jgi:hypothetical protein|uniref:Uncharacterized protein n=1 Tax=Mycolicibacterium chubuense TaxID=1800 RepID=A0A0J6WHK8_MYCCU|nr:hypothetical protein [Mycolicibacterium chubuense]KMO81508.1 hypothetical protein MCHUDSM44219_01861 [Mycolicibacterium chubuense]ORA55592.1 hypothetical protein BST22_03445 [Mycolicibacterium chubuense]SPX95737.1 Uncharacterised protein [Mycolicibacterium chubuense]
MWCPSVSLSVWANSWLAGAAAPDDVLDALSQWTPTHSVTAYDSVAAQRTGLPWPDLDNAGAMSLLQTMRTVARAAQAQPAIALALPVPGDVRGLPPGTQFGRDAIAAGEAIIVGGTGAAIGMVPDFEYPDDYADSPDGDDDEFEPELCGLSWTVYSLDTLPVTSPVDLGEAEYALRDAVRSAADALGALRAGTSGADVADPRRLVEQVLEPTRAHRIPDHAPVRAVRVLENAAHVDAIITVSSGLIPIGLQSSSEVQLASDALRPLGGVVRSARLAAVDAILQSAWRT